MWKSLAKGGRFDEAAMPLGMKSATPFDLFMA
jgi:hypothetical protein